MRGEHGTKGKASIARKVFLMSKQKKIPTLAQLLKIKRKALSTRLFDAWKNREDPDYLVDIVDTRQRCPCTCITVEIYELDVHRVSQIRLGKSCGFSKCCWPDKFDSQHGIDLAARKAIAYIVKEEGLADV